MIVVTTDFVPGYEIVETLGIVTGSIVNSKHLGKDIAAAFKTLAGGEIKSYTELLVESRNIALKRMVSEAEKLGADAVVGVRFGSSSVMQSAAEILAYGTAVKLKKKSRRLELSKYPPWVLNHGELSFVATRFLLILLNSL